MENRFDKVTLDRCLTSYPLLAPILRSGATSRKMVREILGIDKWLMDQIFKDLMVAGAIKMSASGYFKASDACAEYLGKKK